MPYPYGNYLRCVSALLRTENLLNTLQLRLISKCFIKLLFNYLLSYEDTLFSIRAFIPIISLGWTAAPQRR